MFDAINICNYYNLKAKAKLQIKILIVRTWQGKCKKGEN
jgi:hypothetical protein